jgi:hypothetical protein
MRCGRLIGSLIAIMVIRWLGGRVATRRSIKILEARGLVYRQLWVLQGKGKLVPLWKTFQF